MSRACWAVEARSGDEACGEQDRAAEIAAQPLDPRREVDGRADDGEVEPVLAADIAVHDVADMQRDAVVDPGLAGFDPSRR